MNLNLLSMGTADKSVLATMRTQAAFRKATPAMMLTHAAIQSILESNPQAQALLKSQPHRFGLVLSSAFGELETTVDFLKTLADAGVARPLLFQNSLHNSTSGFASIHFRITGPVITVSHGTFPFENALEAANLALGQKQCDYIFVVYVETFITDLVNPTLGAAAKDQAVALLLSSNPEGARASIQDVECLRKAGQHTSYSATYFGGHPAAEQFVHEVESAPAEMNVRQVMRNQKSDHHSSRISWVKK